MTRWNMHEPGAGSRYLTCEALERIRLSHAFTLRPAGAEEGEPGREIPAGALRELRLPREIPLSRPVQVHGARVSRPDGEETSPREADAVLVERPPGAAAVATADCVGAILASEGARAFAVIHSGWRGTLAGALMESIRALARCPGASPDRMILAMGPAIGGCCYEVGPEVIDRFDRLFPEGRPPGLIGRRGDRPTVDLVAANRALAVRCGIPGSRIHAAGICTACRGDICWSYRALGRKAGRQWALAGLP